MPYRLCIAILVLVWPVAKLTQAVCWAFGLLYRLGVNAWRGVRFGARLAKESNSVTEFLGG